jgi:hypothetical protein
MGMLTTQWLIQCRIERKYVLRDGEIDQVRSALRPLLSDPRFRRDQGWITSVYFDRPDGFLTRNALSNPGRNLKVRLREYFTSEGLPDSTFVWIELKDRDGSMSRKNRFQLHKRLVAQFLRGTLDEGVVLTCQGRVSDPAKVVEAVRRIREVAEEGELVPVGAVSCRRAAIEGGEPLARITMDEDVTYHLAPVALYDSIPSLDRESLGPVALHEPASIVELKFRGSSPPAWSQKVLGKAAPVDYSKFRVLSALAFCEQRVD